MTLPADVVFVTSSAASGAVPDRLQQVMLPIIDNEICSQPSWYGQVIDDSMVCAGYEEGQRGNCKVMCYFDLSHYLQLNHSPCTRISAHNTWCHRPSRAICYDCLFVQEAQLSQRDRATRCVSACSAPVHPRTLGHHHHHHHHYYY